MTDIVDRLRDDYEKTIELCAEAAEEIERLRELLEEAAADLALQCDHEHQARETYPDEMRRYKRDMDLVNRIRAAIGKQDD